MSNIKLIHGSCADQNADAVVNAANSPYISPANPNSRSPNNTSVISSKLS